MDSSLWSSHRGWRFFSFSDFFFRLYNFGADLFNITLVFGFVEESLSEICSINTIPQTGVASNWTDSHQKFEKQNQVAADVFLCQTMSIIYFSRKNSLNKLNFNSIWILKVCQIFTSQLNSSYIFWITIVPSILTNFILSICFQKANSISSLDIPKRKSKMNRYLGELESGFTTVRSILKLKYDTPSNILHHEAYNKLKLLIQSQIDSLFIRYLKYCFSHKSTLVTKPFERIR
ncbi:hypothetical protein BpHYR1_022182 [Brachionus plicatilis]|uniref:Uncharacterized protein n=1 Tax=Brachionus plicatilis TaxID=10195 RepID=A0A3M7PEX9_BRAPC|nr:hypothetical protein BpHYR1_022182 [Brachionus plicatilis]